MISVMLILANIPVLVILKVVVEVAEWWSKQQSVVVMWSRPLPISGRRKLLDVPQLEIDITFVLQTFPVLHSLYLHPPSLHSLSSSPRTLHPHTPTLPHTPSTPHTVPPRIISEPPSSQTIAAAPQALTVTFESQLQENTTVTWFKGESPLSQSRYNTVFSSLNRTHGTTALTFDSVTRSDRGTYRVVVESSLTIIPEEQRRTESTFVVGVVSKSFSCDSMHTRVLINVLLSASLTPSNTSCPSQLLPRSPTFFTHIEGFDLLDSCLDGSQ